MRANGGFTLLEILIALAVIGIAFTAMAMVQVMNIHTSVSSRSLSETKAAANQVLEEQMADVLVVTGTAPNLDFVFHDYYWSCPTYQADPDGTANNIEDQCDGATTVENVDVSYRIAGESGILGEGVLTVTVTAVHESGQSITIGDRITCYDVYPSPTSTAPEPCPAPGEGRS